MPRMGSSLTAGERETVVLMDDESDMALITTWQRPLITKLRNNPAAELVWERNVGSSRGAQFRLPAEFVSFRSKKRTGGPGNAAALANGRSRNGSGTEHGPESASSPVRDTSEQVALGVAG